jgi:hypothetical protein
MIIWHASRSALACVADHLVQRPVVVGDHAAARAPERHRSGRHLVPHTIFAPPRATAILVLR